MKKSFFKIIRSPLAIILLFTLYFCTAMIMSSTQGYIRWSTLFEADFPRIFRDITDFYGNHLRTNVHPIYVLMLNPFGLLFTWMFGSPINAVLFLTAVFGALSAYFAYRVFVALEFKRIHSVLFTAILTFSAAHWLFASMPETYMFTVASLIILLYFSITKPGNLKYLIPAGVFSSGMLTTNFFMDGVIYFFSILKRFDFKSAIKKTLIYLGILVGVITVLTFVQKAIYPTSMPFYNVQIGGSNGEYRFVFLPKTLYDVFIRLGRLVFDFCFYNFSAPTPIPYLDEVNTFEEILLINFIGLSQYPLAGKIAFGIWAALIGASVYSIVRNKIYRLPLFQALIVCLAFNFALHSFYGEEIYLYICDWTFFMLVVIALGLKPLLSAGGVLPKILTGLLIAYLIFQIVNNLQFLQYIYDFLIAVRWKKEGL